MKEPNYEIERKYLIKYPELEKLRAASDETEICQTYLLNPDGGTERVRKRGKNGSYTYTHTVKYHINPLKKIENEREISREEYERLLCRADPARKAVNKLRFCLPYRGQIFEIDVYPFWDDRAIMEIELEYEEQPVQLPDSVEVIRELSRDKRYTNASIAKKIPMDNI